MNDSGVLFEAIKTNTTTEYFILALTLGILIICIMIQTRLGAVKEYLRHNEKQFDQTLDGINKSLERLTDILNKMSDREINQDAKLDKLINKLEK